MPVAAPLGDARPLERALWAAAAVLFLTGAAGDRVPWLRGPAPYPPEWQWPLRETLARGSAWPPILAALGLIALLAATASRPARDAPGRAGRALLLAGSVLGVLFPLALAATEPEGALPTLFGRVAYRTATSYYTVALSPEADDPLEFLRRHDALLPTFRKGAKHAATHPPGPVLFYRGLIGLCDHAPALTRTVLSVAGLPEANPRRPRPEHSASARAAGVLGALLVLAACVATAWPLAALARSLGCGPLASARIGILWTLLPGPVVMLPQFDQALALPVALSALALARALWADEHALAWSAAAGLAGGAALALSYGAPAFLAIAGTAVLCASVAAGAPLVRGIRRSAVAAAVTAAMFVAPALVGHHPIASAVEALRIHREFFTEPRDYGTWLVFDPLDLAVFLGVPVAVSLVFALLRALRRLAAGVALRPDEAFRLGAVTSLVLLVLSGQTRGEVGRIWIPIMPVLLLAALARPELENADDSPSATSAAVLAAAVAPLTMAIGLWWRFF